MKTLIYYGPKDIRFEDRPIPEPGPGEVVIRVGTALTCGTDFKAYRQGHRVLLGEGPTPFGHEAAGTIHKTGPGAPPFRTGERVVAANSAPCGACANCEREESNLCENLVLHNGAYAEYMRIPRHIAARNLHRIPDSLEFSQAAMAEPLACVLRCLSKLSLEAGSELAVIGTGTMGLLLCHAASRLGARVTMIGRTPEKLTAARAFGASATLRLSGPEDLPPAARPGAAAPVGFPLVVEAVGRPETWQLAVALARKGGRVCFYGGCAIGTQIPVDSYKIHYHELTLMGSFHHAPRDFTRAVQMLSEGRLETSLFIRGRIPLSELKGLFEREAFNNPPKLAVVPDA